MISVVIIHYGTPEPLAQTLAAFSPPAGPPEDVEIIVVDNATLGPLAEAMREIFPHIRFLINEQNVGFGKAANAGAKVARGDRILFLNGDCFIQPSQLTNIEQGAGNLNNFGAAGFAQITPQGWPQLTFGQFPTFRSEFQRRKWQKALDRDQAKWAADKIRSLGNAPVETDWVSGSCLLIDKASLEKIGGFDERFFMYFEDIDLCRRVVAEGRKVYYCPEPKVLHLHGASAQGSPTVARVAYRESQLYYARKHQGTVNVLAIRCYLFARCCAEWIVGVLKGDRVKKTVATQVIAKLFKS